MRSTGKTGCTMTKTFAHVAFKSRGNSVLMTDPIYMQLETDSLLGYRNAMIRVGMSSLWLCWASTGS